MKISGFTMVRNGAKYYFPVKESILSILPVVDEFIIALGDNDEDDRTREEIESINSDKIKIIDRIWNEEDFVQARIFAQETTFALDQCEGDWCFYLQADEVIHENDLPVIKEACEKYLYNRNIDGFLLKFYHFFGDYEHYLPYHGWYKNEIRIVRNGIGVYSYKDAQSFRKQDNQKLNVLSLDAHVYHYGWVRPPHLMQSKKKEFDTMYRGKEKIDQEYQSRADYFDYGALGRVPVFKGSHPKVMDDFRARISWTDRLNYSKKSVLNRNKTKHETFKYRFITLLENTFNGGNELFGFSNWKKVSASGKE